MVKGREFDYHWIPGEDTTLLKSLDGIGHSGTLVKNYSENLHKHICCMISILLDSHFWTSQLYVIFTNPINSRSSAWSKCVELDKYVCRMILFSSQSSEINIGICTFAPSISSSTNFVMCSGTGCE